MKYFILSICISLFASRNFDAAAQQHPITEKPQKVKKAKKQKAVRSNTVSATKANPAQPAVDTLRAVEAEADNTAEHTTAKPAQAAAAARPPQKDLDAFVQAHAQPIVETLPNGEVNWTSQYITARGESVIDTERFKNAAQAKAMARRGAIVEAQRNLLEIIQGVNVVGETKVRDMITESDYIYSRVDGIIKGAEIIGEPIEKDGLITVSLRVPLYQPSGLAPVFYTGQTNTATAHLARNTGSSQAAPQAQSTSVSRRSATAPDVSPFAFNLNGQQIDPSLFPVLVDENNNLLFDLSKVYDPTTGQFPQLLQTTKMAFENAGFKNGVEVIDVVQTAPGKLVVSEKDKEKISNWSKVGKTLLDIGKVLLLLL